MRRVVVTGIGLTCPAGKTVNEYWNNLLKGVNFAVESDSMIKMGLQSSTHAVIDDKSHLNIYKSELDNFIKFGLYAGEQAWKDSHLEDKFNFSKERVGVISASAIGGTQTVSNKFEELLNDNGVLSFNNNDSLFYDSGMYHTLNVLLKEKLGLKGISTSLSTGCTAGMDCLGLGFEEIKDGDLDVCLVGASEAPLVDFTYATLDVISCLSKNPETNASSPFSLERNGFVISEGAAFLVLEEYNHAKNRGAHIYAEIEDFHSTNNAEHMTNLKSDGESMYSLLNILLKNKKMKIDYINAHGSSTKQNDLFETVAFKKFFGKEIYNIPISSTKSMIGHSLSSASLFGCISAIMSINTSEIHPTINFNIPDEECDLDYVPNKKIDQKVDTSLITASGFGGIHSGTIIKKVEEGIMNE
ncbi:TPA: beta-ketoacyl-[acyl-carrier-protein] synthase family protein [Staphylococcus aureus]